MPDHEPGLTMLRVGPWALSRGVGPMTGRWLLHRVHDNPDGSTYGEMLGEHFGQDDLEHLIDLLRRQSTRRWAGVRDIGPLPLKPYPMEDDDA